MRNGDLIQQRVRLGTAASHLVGVAHGGSLPFGCSWPNHPRPTTRQASGGEPPLSSSTKVGTSSGLLQLSSAPRRPRRPDPLRTTPAEDHSNDPGVNDLRQLHSGRFADETCRCHWAGRVVLAGLTGPVVAENGSS